MSNNNSNNNNNDLTIGNTILAFVCSLIMTGGLIWLAIYLLKTSPDSESAAIPYLGLMFCALITGIASIVIWVHLFGETKKKWQYYFG